jgi:hypothetical protein
MGFLFGIPRTSARQQKGPEPSKDKVRGEQTTYQANTNLEEISDWLTKILVGVGLTQLREIPAGIETLAGRLGPVLGNSAGSGAFAVTVLLFFAVCGFLEGYLWTRLFLAGEFRLADLMTLGQRVEEVHNEAQEAVRKLQQQRERDAHAMALALAQLNPAAGGPPMAQSELDEAILAASPEMCAQVFYLTHNQRTSEWNRDKEKMEATIPVFRALIAREREKKYHRNHAQLGYALKDQRQPNWQEAQRRLTEAIELRGRWQDQGWLWYEFNRAVCSIALDEAFQQGLPSPASKREDIIVDLRAAATELEEFLGSDTNIVRWLGLNSIEQTDLRTVAPRTRRKMAQSAGDTK